MHEPLVALQRRRGLGAEVAVERAVVDAAARQQELQHGHVEPEVAPLQDARAEQRPAERAEGDARARVGGADRKVVRALECVDRRRRAGACDPVDLREVEPVRAQGDLEPGDLRVDAGEGGGGRGESRDRRKDGETSHGGWDLSPRPARLLQIRRSRSRRRSMRASSRPACTRYASTFP